MKTKLTRKILITLLGLVSLLGLGDIAQAQTGSECNALYELKGSAWSENIGDILFEQADVTAANGPSSGVGVTLCEGGSIEGKAWSLHLGWVDFGYHNASWYVDETARTATGDQAVFFIGQAQFLSGLNSSFAGPNSPCAVAGTPNATDNDTDCDGWNGVLKLDGTYSNNKYIFTNAKAAPTAASEKLSSVQSSSRLGYGIGETVVGWVQAGARVKIDDVGGPNQTLCQAIIAGGKVEVGARKDAAGLPALSNYTVSLSTTAELEGGVELVANFLPRTDDKEYFKNAVPSAYNSGNSSYSISYEYGADASTAKVTDGANTYQTLELQLLNSDGSLFQITRSLDPDAQLRDCRGEIGVVWKVVEQDITCNAERSGSNVIFSLEGGDLIEEDFGSITQTVDIGNNIDENGNITYTFDSINPLINNIPCSYTVVDPCDSGGNNVCYNKNNPETPIACPSDELDNGKVYVKVGNSTPTYGASGDTCEIVYEVKDCTTDVKEWSEGTAACFTGTPTIKWMCDSSEMSAPFINDTVISDLSGTGDDYRCTCGELTYEISFTDGLAKGGNCKIGNETEYMDNVGMFGPSPFIKPHQGNGIDCVNLGNTKTLRLTCNGQQLQSRYQFNNSGGIQN